MSDSRFGVSNEAAPHEMARLRASIDRVDEVLVRLLNQRTQYAIEIGRLKGQLGIPVYSPEREKEVLNNVEGWSVGPLEPAAMRRLFERIIDEARAVERHALGDIHGHRDGEARI